MSNILNEEKSKWDRGEKYCDICDRKIYGQYITTHMKTRKHILKEKKKINNILEITENNININDILFDIENLINDD